MSQKTQEADSLGRGEEGGGCGGLHLWSLLPVNLHPSILFVYAILYLSLSSQALLGMGGEGNREGGRRAREK